MLYTAMYSPFRNISFGMDQQTKLSSATTNVSSLLSTLTSPFLAVNTCITHLCCLSQRYRPGPAALLTHPGPLRLHGGAQIGPVAVWCAGVWIRPAGCINRKLRGPQDGNVSLRESSAQCTVCVRVIALRLIAR